MYYKKKVKKIKNNCFKNDKLIKQLIKSKNQYGCLKNNLKCSNKPYIYGFKAKQSVINIEQTSISLKKLFNLIRFFLNNKPYSKILFICSDYQKNKLEKISLNKKNINFMSKWHKGYLLDNPDKYGLIILFSSNNFEIIQKETALLKLPIITFLSPETPIKRLNQINYPIFYNNKKIESIYFILSLFTNFIKL